MRGLVFDNDQVYHVFNRGVEKRPPFTDKREYQRGILTADYYRNTKPSLRLSKVLQLNAELETQFFNTLEKENRLIVDILCYCLMPNHFHFLLKQKEERGVPKFMSMFTNSYTKYFNTKQKRNGPLFQGNFKAVWIEDDDQLMHVSRYIHLNPVVSYIIKEQELDSFPWSSFREYLGQSVRSLCNTDMILSQFKSAKEYRSFVHNQIDYAKTLYSIEHLTMEV